MVNRNRSIVEIGDSKSVQSLDFYRKESNARDRMDQLRQATQENQQIYSRQQSHDKM